MAQAKKDAFQIDADGLVPNCFVKLYHRREPAFDASVVEEAIKAPELSRGLLHIGLHLRGLTDIGLHGEGLAAQPVDVGGGLGGGFGINIHHYNASASAGKLQSGGTANAITTARDERDPVGQIKFFYALSGFAR